MELEATPSRVSKRLAKKRKHAGKPGCPCCVDDDVAQDSTVMITRKTPARGRSNDISEAEHQPTNKSSPVERQRRRVRITQPGNVNSDGNSSFVIASNNSLELPNGSVKGTVKVSKKKQNMNVDNVSSTTESNKLEVAKAQAIAQGLNSPQSSEINNKTFPINGKRGTNNGRLVRKPPIKEIDEQQTSGQMDGKSVRKNVKKCVKFPNKALVSRLQCNNDIESENKTVIIIEVPAKDDKVDNDTVEEAKNSVLNIRERDIIDAGDGGVDEDADDELVQVMAEVNNDSTTRNMVFDSVSALMNESDIAMLDMRCPSWEGDLASVCPVRLAVCGTRHMLIADSMETLGQAHTVLSKMLTKADTKAQMRKSHETVDAAQIITASEKSDNHDISNDITEDPQLEDPDSIPDLTLNVTEDQEKNPELISSQQMKNSKQKTDEIFENMEHEVLSAPETISNVNKLRWSNNYEKKCVSTRLNRAQTLFSEMTKKGKPDNVFAKRRSHRYRKDASEGMNVQDSVSDNVENAEMLDACGEVVPHAKDPNITENVEIDATDKMDESHSVPEENTIKIVTKEEEDETPLNLEELQNFVETLEANLVKDDVDPTEIWKVLAKPYKRSDRTNKCEVNQSDLKLCDLCNEYLGTEPAILAHKRRIHPKVVYRCDDCNKPFGLKLTCLMHRLTHLGKGKRYQVKLFLEKRRKMEEDEAKAAIKHINIDKLSNNMGKGTSTIVTDPSRAVHDCKYCTYKGTRIGVASHLLRYHPRKLHKCGECGKTYGTKYQMSMHRESHAMQRMRKAKKAREERMLLHPTVDGIPVSLPDEYKKIHLCDICGFSTTKTGLVQHKIRHHQPHIHMCDLCGKCFTRQSELATHRAMHFDNDGNLRKIRKYVQNEGAILSSEIVENTDVGTNIVYQHGEKSELLTVGENSQILTVGENSEILTVGENSQILTVGENSQILTVGENSQILTVGENSELLTVRETSEIFTIGLVKPEENSNKTGSVDRVYTCEICGFVTSFHGLRMHKKRKHKEKRYECEICSKKFYIGSQLDKHRRTHYTESGELKPWEKEKCGLASGESIPCDDCELVFKSQRALEIHCSRMHKVKRYMCEFCLYQGSTKNDVDVHVARIHKSKEYKCDVCGKCYAFAKELAKHKEIHHDGSEQCKCHICGQEFKMQRYLKGHLLRHAGEYRYSCTICGKGFMDKVRLHEHEQTHRNVADRDIKFFCEVCSKGFLRQGALKQHMLTHTKERKYFCNICSRSFGLMQSLQKHKLRHRMIKPFQCPVAGCSKGFVDQTSLNYHSVIHSGESSHKCQTCGKLFTQAATLRKHVCRMAINARKVLNNPQGLEAVKLEPIMTSNSASILKSNVVIDQKSPLVIQPDQLHLLQQLGIEGQSDQTIQVLNGNIPGENVTIILKNEQEVGEDHGNVIDETRAEQFLCSVCQQLFSTWEEIEVHMSLHTDGDAQNFLDSSHQDVSSAEVMTSQMMTFSGSEVMTVSEVMDVSGSEVMAVSGSEVLAVSGSEVAVSGSKIMTVSGSEVAVSGSEVMAVSGSEVMDITATEITPTELLYIAEPDVGSTSEMTIVEQMNPDMDELIIKSEVSGSEKQILNATILGDGRVVFLSDAGEIIEEIAEQE